MIRQHQRRAIGHRATTLFVAGSLLALAALIFVGCDRPAQQSGSDAPGTPEPSTMNLEWMVNGADAIVIGNVVRELEPTSVTRPEYIGAEPTMITEEFRNFALEVEESYVPGVDESTTIAVRVQTNPRVTDRDGKTRELAVMPEFEVGLRTALFLRHTDRWAVDGVGPPPPPDGFNLQMYFGFLPTYHVHPPGPFEAGGLVQDGDRWVHRPSGESTTQAELEQAVIAHAEVIPRDCRRISDRGDYAWIRTIREFMQQADVVIKGRMGGEVAARRGDAAVDVIEVVAGEIDSHEITLDGYGFRRAPGFGTCDYYMFLTKHIPEFFLDEGVPSERLGVYRLTGGPQAAFAIHAGIIDKGGLSFPEFESRAVPEEQFRTALFEAVLQTGSHSQ